MLMPPSDPRDATAVGDRPEKAQGTVISPFRSAREPAPRHAIVPATNDRRAFDGPLYGHKGDPSRSWEHLTAVTPDARSLARAALVAADDPVAGIFDVLRTRVLQAMEEHGWTRLAITSPTHGCGKTYTALNLGFSVARLPGKRVILIDLELRKPGIAAALGVPDATPIRDFLMGEQPLESHVRRIGQNFALCMNDTAVANAPALLGDPATCDTLEAMENALTPDLVIYDMPPALVSDDVIAFRPMIDAVLIVADGTRTTAADLQKCERLFENRLPILGIILNRAEDRGLDRYRYGRR